MGQIRQHCVKTNGLNNGQTRTNGQEGSTFSGTGNNHSLGVASVCPNTKFRSLLSTIGLFEASEWPETSRIVQQKRCCAPPGQCHDTHSVITNQKLWEIGLEVLKHPPYSSDQTITAFISHCKTFHSDKKLGSREDCKNRLLEFFRNKGKDFNETGNMKLPLKWQYFIQQNDTYLTQIGQSEAC
ncbi:hypothetical protein TNCV_4211001 [Trichonephila clavipes]|nr:hypothetical protein TNCV_4211001 [Trichonephila clavipes]